MFQNQNAPSKKKNGVPKTKIDFSISHMIVFIYCALMFVAFPLYLSNYYGAARRDKFGLFITLTLVAIVAIIAAAIFENATMDPAYKKKRRSNTYFFGVLTDKFSLNCTDIGILSFLLINFLSAILDIAEGASVEAAFMGTNGRNMGVVMIVIMTIAYFMVSRLFYIKKYVLCLYMLGMGVMTFLAIANYYYFDPLSIFEAYENSSNYQTVLLNYTSTIGNKNMLSAMICVALPFSVGMAVISKDKVAIAISYISVAIQSMGLIVATSDGGYLGCFAAFIIMVIVCCRDFKKLSRLFVAFAVFIGSVKLLYLFDLLMGGNNKGYTSFSELFLYTHQLLILIPIFAGLAVLFWYLQRNEANFAKFKQILFISLCVILVIGILSGVGLFIYYSNLPADAEVRGFAEFFRFNEDWGTHRGFFWIKSFAIFDNFDLTEKIFGSGPDSYKISFNEMDGFEAELSEKYHESSVNAAHSVYINYLVTLGVFGVAAYLFFIGSSIKDAYKSAKSNPLALVCLFVIVSYAVQDIVNIANPINVPWYILVIAISQSVRMKPNQSDYVNDEI